MTMRCYGRQYFRGRCGRHDNGNSSNDSIGNVRVHVLVLVDFRRRRDRSHDFRRSYQCRRLSVPSKLVHSRPLCPLYLFRVHVLLLWPYDTARTYDPHECDSLRCSEAILPCEISSDERASTTKTRFTLDITIITSITSEARRKYSRVQRLHRQLPRFRLPCR